MEAGVVKEFDSVPALMGRSQSTFKSSECEGREMAKRAERRARRGQDMSAQRATLRAGNGCSSRCDGGRDQVLPPLFAPKAGR